MYACRYACVKRFERSNGLDSALYRKSFFKTFLCKTFSLFFLRIFYKYMLLYLMKIKTWLQIISPRAVWLVNVSM